MKHKHNWQLKYVDAGTLGKGLLYFCKDCNYCLEFSKKRANLKKVCAVYEEEIKRILDYKI